MVAGAREVQVEEHRRRRRVMHRRLPVQGPALAHQRRPLQTNRKAARVARRIRVWQALKVDAALAEAVEVAPVASVAPEEEMEHFPAEAVAACRIPIE